ncbi:sensor domain-containing protein [Mycobacterium sp. 050128]|uniref:sensor domain-containing protein n=1 Tax=unclassified Mycobacterium TaxID=2642494 RepID=UPI002ED7E907
MSLQHYHLGLAAPHAPSAPVATPQRRPAPTARPEDEVTVVTGPRRAPQDEVTLVVDPRRAPLFRTPAPMPAAGPHPWPGGPQFPPAGWAPAQYPIPGRRRNTRRTWAITAAATAATLVIAATAVALTAGDTGQSSSAGATTTPVAATPSPSTTTPAPAPIVPVTALPGLLSDPAALNAIVGSPAMALQQTVNRMDDPKSDTPDCLGTYHPIEQAAYQGSGWIAMQGQLLHESGTAQWKHVVIQGVVSFPTAQAAADFVTTQHNSWSKCQGKPATANYEDGPETYVINAVKFQTGILTAQMIQEGGGGWRCQHALNARNNVVADVAACGFAPDDQATAIAAAINGRIEA